MKRIVLITLILSCIATPVAAQASNNSTTTATSTPTVTATPTASPTPTDTPDDNSSTVVAIGPNTRVTSWSYGGGAFHLTIEADIPVRLTISQAVQQDGSGAGSITYQRRNLASGRNEFRVPAPTKGGDATIILSTPASTANDRAAFIHHNGSGASLLSGPFDGSDVRDVGIGSSIGTALGALYVVARAKLGADQRGERLA